MNYDLLVPVMRSEILLGLLTSIYNQTKRPVRLVLRDNAKSSLMRNYQIRFILDALQIEGVDIRYLRDNLPKDAAKSRNVLFENSISEVIAYADDDAIWSYNVGQLLLNAIEDGYHFALPNVLTPNEESNVPNYVYPLEYDKHQQFTKHQNPTRIQVSEGSGCTMFFNRKVYDDRVVKAMDEWGGGLSLDDRVIMRIVKNGVIEQRAEVWHMMSPVNRTMPLGGFSRTEDRLLDKMYPI